MLQEPAVGWLLALVPVERAMPSMKFPEPFGQRPAS